jgi:hypothetical protein
MFGLSFFSSGYCFFPTSLLKLIPQMVNPFPSFSFYPVP